MNEFSPFYVDDDTGSSCGSGSGSGGGVVENNPKKGAPVSLKTPLQCMVRSPCMSHPNMRNRLRCEQKNYIFQST